MKDLKVLHINSYYSVSPFYKNLYEEQIRVGISIDVFTPVAKGFIVGDRSFGKYTNISANHNRFDRYIFHLKHLKILNSVKRIYDISGFDIIHAHSLFSNGYIAYRLNKEFGIPYVVAVRDTDVNVFFNKMLHLRKLGIKILQHANKIVFLSGTYLNNTIQNYVPRDLQKRLEKDSVIIPNGIDAFWLDNRATKPKSINRNNINILYVGRLSKRKNILTTIKACQILQDRGYDITFSVVGPVEDQKMYREILQHSFIKYFGPQAKEKLISFYRSNDIFVMPSITETFGLVYAEAMSQGLPVIYTKGQGFDSQFEEGTVGYHVNCFNPDVIADRINDIIDNYEALSKNCLRLCVRFDWCDIAQKYLSIYNEVLNSTIRH